MIDAIPIGPNSTDPGFPLSHLTQTAGSPIVS